MMKLLSSIALMFLMIFVPITQAQATTTATPSVACEYEDSTNCYWDAQAQGNGLGQSFYDIDGVTHYVGDEAPEVAPVVWEDAATAWTLFDAVDAASLLTDGGQVTYSYSTTADVQPSQTTIIVWDLSGTTHVFDLS